MEPKKYLVVLRWMALIRVPLIGCRKSTHDYDGRNLVIPFLSSLLPAIDPNDLVKTVVTLSTLICYFNLITCVDCSSLCSDIPEDDQVISKKKLSHFWEKTHFCIIFCVLGRKRSVFFNGLYRRFHAPVCRSHFLICGKPVYGEYSDD